MAGTLVEKRCKRCGEVKSAREFSRHRKERDGLQGNCKACNAADWEANREAIAARRRGHWLGPRSPPWLRMSRIAAPPTGL